MSQKHNNIKQVAVIGAGPAGLQTAMALSQNHVQVLLIDKQAKTGGHLEKWSHLFPDSRPSNEVLKVLQQGIQKENIQILNNKRVSKISKSNGQWELGTDDGLVINSDAVVIATGFNTFDAHQKEEYGYGIYPAVVTSETLESIFKGETAWPFNSSGKDLRFGFVHCVGSRDAKCGNLYCSKVCCVTAVKQSIELKKKFPHASVYCFYMDMRMFGTGYEELYQEAQTKYNIQFIRGRLSEASPAGNNRIQVKAEDTLLGRPAKLTLDMLVLMVGITPAVSLEIQNDAVYLKAPELGASFIKPDDGFLRINNHQHEGLFITGACKGPASIPEVLQDAKATSIEVMNYLSKKTV